METARVLLVEDDDMNRVVISMFLEDHVVTEAHNGLEAVILAFDQLSSQEPMDMIILDVNMPILDGRRAAGLIRRMASRNGPWATHVPVLGLTASALETELKRCVSSGMTCALAKPVAQHTLLDLVRDAMAKRRSSHWRQAEVPMLEAVGDADDTTAVFRHVIALAVSALRGGIGVRAHLQERTRRTLAFTQWALTEAGMTAGAQALATLLQQRNLDDQALLVRALDVFDDHGDFAAPASTL